MPKTKTFVRLKFCQICLKQKPLSVMLKTKTFVRLKLKTKTLSGMLKTKTFVSNA
jgi:hypothetical protein